MSYRWFNETEFVCETTVIPSMRSWPRPGYLYGTFNKSWFVLGKALPGNNKRIRESDVPAVIRTLNLILS